jgi:hypothetical protein
MSFLWSVRSVSALDQLPVEYTPQGVSKAFGALRLTILLYRKPDDLDFEFRRLGLRPGGAHRRNAAMKAENSLLVLFLTATTSRCFQYRSQ